MDTFLIKSRGSCSQTPWITTKKRGIHAFVGYSLQHYISCGHFFKKSVCSAEVGFNLSLSLSLSLSRPSFFHFLTPIKHIGRI